jgi:hypothetical protein
MEISIKDQYGNRVGYINGLNDIMDSTAEKSVN